jgi:hypothetical protein
MLSLSSLYSPFGFRFLMLCVNSVEFVVLYVFGRLSMFWSFLCQSFASLYAGELILLITGHIDMLSLCIFGCALSCGGDGLICVRYMP